MNISIIDGAIVFDPSSGKPKQLTTADFAEKEPTVSVKPAYYVALGADGLMARSVSVTIEDRQTVAALVGNWIAEGFQPLPCDIAKFSKYVRELAAASKPPKVDATPPAANTPAGGAPDANQAPGAPSGDPAPAPGDNKSTDAGAPAPAPAEAKGAATDI